VQRDEVGLGLRRVGSNLSRAVDPEKQARRTEPAALDARGPGQLARVASSSGKVTNAASAPLDLPAGAGAVAKSWRAAVDVVSMFGGSGLAFCLARPRSLT
jgi:hypothetical protein